MRVRIFVTLGGQNGPVQREAGQISLAEDGSYSVHPTTPRDAKLCNSVATDPVRDLNADPIRTYTPKDGELFMRQLAHTYDGAYLRVSKVEE